MHLEDPDSFFLRNGGRALLEANGITGELSLRRLFDAQFDTWPKAGGKVGRTRVGSLQQGGVLCVWEGGLELRSPAALSVPSGSGSVAVGKGLSKELAVIGFAMECMDRPRPLLFLTIGASYAEALRTARLTLDHRMVESCGSVAFVLDSDRIGRIREAAAHFGSPPALLRAARRGLEVAVANPGVARTATIVSRAVVAHPSHGSVLRRLAKDLGLKGLGKAATDPAHVAPLADYWNDVSMMPPSGDPSWLAAGLKADGGDGAGPGLGRSDQ